MSQADTRGLHPAESVDQLGRRAYCGRFALRVATGASYEEITRAINGCRGRKPEAHVKGTWASELEHVVKTLGLRFSTCGEGPAYPAPRYPTLTGWLRDRRSCAKSTYLVNITGHWIVVKGDWLVDTFHREPHDLSRSNPYARRRVKWSLRLWG